MSVLTDRTRDLPSFVPGHQGMQIIHRLVEEVAGIEAMSAQNFLLDHPHRPKEKKGEDDHMNRQDQEKGSPPGARNPSGQPLQSIEKPVGEVHSVHSSE